MAGKVFDGVISSQMRFKKNFFPTNLWRGEKDHARQILSQKLRSNSGDEKMKS